MEYTEMTSEQIKVFIKVFQELFDGKYSALSEHNKELVRQKLRDAKLEYILSS